MPRRPRPAHRAAPKPEVGIQQELKNEKFQSHGISSISNIFADDEDGQVEPDNIAASNSEIENFDLNPHDDGESSEDGEDSLANLPDVPRVAQWADDDDFTSQGASTLRILERDLSAIPLGALRKARLAIPQAIATSNHSESEESEEEAFEEQGISTLGRKGSDFGKNHFIGKRSNKHAPVEVTSKKPVTRKMQAVDVKKQEVRDPRFLPLTGEFSVQKFRQSYGFLTENHMKEFNTLKDSLKRARKLLANSPKTLYEEREEAVKGLELAVKKAESQVDRDRKEKAEHDALQKLAEEERQKRKEGKGEWYLKKSSQREILARARYESLAADGGNRAVKKAIAKKQKKIGQKEKKSRPFSMKRRFETEGALAMTGRDSKRMRVGLPWE